MKKVRIAVDKKPVEIFAIIFVVLFSLFIRLINLHYNSIFSDEALYIVFGQKVWHGTWSAENAFSWISSMPLLYPPLAAVGFNLGSLIGARVVNVIAGVISIYAFYTFTKLFLMRYQITQPTIPALFAALFLSISPIHLWLSRLAIQDIFAFMLVVVGMVFIEKGFEQKWQVVFMVAALMHILSFLAKYTVLIILPFITVYYLYIAYRERSLFMAYVSYYLLTVFICIIGYFFSFYTQLIELITSYSLVEESPVSLVDQVMTFGTFTTLWVGVSLVGLVMLSKEKSNRISLGVFLLIAFVPLVFHLVTGSDNALEQTSLFSLLFLLPFAGIVLAYAWARSRIGKGIVLVLITGMYVVFYKQQTDLEQQWANSSRVMEYLRTSVSLDDLVLTQEDDSTVLALDGIVNRDQVIGPYNFSYKELSDDEAYKQAVADKYFTYIQLTNETSDLYESIGEELDKNYQLIYDEAPYRVYVVKGNDQ